MSADTADLKRKQEMDWHDELFRTRQPAVHVVPARIRDRYLKDRRRPLFPLEMMFKLAGDVRNKNVLVFGCGDSNVTVLLALKGGRVWAFDLSCEALRTQREMAIANGVSERVHLVAGAAEELPFRGPCFDVIFGSAILHHLPDALPRVPTELSRILRNGGFAIFSEPFVQSRSIQWLRSFFPHPKGLSPRERQLTPADLEPFRAHFHVATFYFHGISRLEQFVLKGTLRDSQYWRKALVYGFHAFDYLLFRLRTFRSLAGIIVLKLTPNTRSSRD